MEDNREAPRRTAHVKGATAYTVSQYLPGNYEVAGVLDDGTVVVSGHDRFGWSMDDYIIPRLESHGTIGVREII